MLIAYTNYLRVVCVCVCPGEGNVAFNAKPNPFHLNKICLNQLTNNVDSVHLIVLCNNISVI